MLYLGVLNGGPEYADARDEIGDAGLGRARHASTWQRPGRKGTFFNAQQNNVLSKRCGGPWDGPVSNGGEKVCGRKKYKQKKGGGLLRK